LAAAVVFGVRRVEVHGPSMLPTLAPGERLVVVRTWRVRPGDVIVLVDPAAPDRALVKRALAISGGEVTVGGDNSSLSVDSRRFGPVALDRVLGRAAYRYHPPHQRGRIARQGGLVP
jgi:nickel-type superoxide dismutase maturation protease